MHKDNQDKVTRLPFDKDLVNQDEKGSTTLCPHGEYPTYDAMDYTPEQLIIQRETPPPTVSPPPEIEPPELPDTGDIGGNEEVPCPGPGQLRVGDVTAGAFISYLTTICSQVDDNLGTIWHQLDENGLATA